MRIYLKLMLNKITIDPLHIDTMSCIRGLCIPIATIVNLVAEGMSFDEILNAYPELRTEDLAEALKYMFGFDIC